MVAIPKVVQDAVSEAANALQGAIGLSASMRRDAQSTADQAAVLEGTISRAVAALKRLQPPSGRGERIR